MRKVKIFDTTLRDGEQTPRVNLNKEDKIKVAKQLELLGVDIIEAGFPASGTGDFEGVKAVAESVTKPTICALARLVKKDIEISADAIKNANKPRIHVFLATSDIHLKYKLKISREEVLKRVKEMVAYAKSLIDDIQFSAEDATRTDKDFICRVFEVAIEAGASTLNVPDTVGFMQPMEYFEFIKYIKENTRGIEKANISVHCHDDLGLATANALAGALGGATQIECTVNGLGERAGNTAVEEIAMAVDTREEYYDFRFGIDTTKIYETSKLVSALTGVNISPTKSIIGRNCFLHESGIHQDGILKNRKTYEIMDPEKIGIPQNDGIVLGKHSGRHAFKSFLKNNGINTEEKDIDNLFSKFKILTNTKKYISVEDIANIVENEKNINFDYEFISYESNTLPNGEVKVLLKMRRGNNILEAFGLGNGQIDASFRAINKIIGKNIEVLNYELQGVSLYSNSKGEARVKIKLDDKVINSSGLDTDVIKASIYAYVQGINKLDVQ